MYTDLYDPVGEEVLWFFQNFPEFLTGREGVCATNHRPDKSCRATHHRPDISCLCFFLLQILPDGESRSLSYSRSINSPTSFLSGVKWNRQRDVAKKFAQFFALNPYVYVLCWFYSMYLTCSSCPPAFLICWSVCHDFPKGIAPIGQLVLKALLISLVTPSDSYLHMVTDIKIQPCFALLPFHLGLHL